MNQLAALWNGGARGCQCFGCIPCSCCGCFPSCMKGKPVESNNVQNNNKKAFLVGINYEGTEHKLVGCANDAEQHKTVLREHYGFDDNNIVTLTDGPGHKELESLPTKRDILLGWAWLCQDAKAGDILFFAYSGYGSQVKDPHSKGCSECICPLDSVSDGSIVEDNVITVEEFHEIFTNVPDGVLCVCVFDCCHSATEFVPSTCCRKASGTVPNTVARAVPPPPDVVFNQATNHAPPSSKEAKLLWIYSACASGRTNADTLVKNEPHGTFTWAFLAAQKDRDYKGTYYQILKDTRSKLASLTDRMQVPELAATHEVYKTWSYLHK